VRFCTSGAGGGGGGFHDERVGSTGGSPGASSFVDTSTCVLCSSPAFDLCELGASDGGGGDGGGTA